MDTVTIGQLAKGAGVGLQTIRYYERLWLVVPTARRESGYRLYGEQALQRLRFVRNAQQLGFTLKEVRELLDLRASSTARCASVQVKALTKLKQVDHKIRELQNLRRALRRLNEACEAGRPTAHCPILASLNTERSHDNAKRKATR